MVVIGIKNMITKENIRKDFYGDNDARAYDYDELFIMEQYAIEYHKSKIVPICDKCGDTGIGGEPTLTYPEGTKCDCVVNILAQVYLEIHSLLETIENYLCGEHNHETDKIQQKEDMELMTETNRLKNILKKFEN